MLDQEIPSGAVGKVLRKLHTTENDIEGYHWFIVLIVALLYFGIIVATSWNGDPQTEILAQKMKNFSIKYGNSLGKQDPFAGNLLIFYLYKGFSVFFGAF